MSKKIAVAVVHGIGKQAPNFADDITNILKDRFVKELKNAVSADELVIKPVYWAPVFNDAEKKLWKQLRQGGDLDFTSLRQFIIDFGADAVAYQPIPTEVEIDGSGTSEYDRSNYDAIHSIFAETLKALASEAGADAPLCIIAHSLGSVIASNYAYDLQTDSRRPIISQSVRDVMTKPRKDNPLEWGDTLTLFYTLGSPIPLWSLRYQDFGVPIVIPAPGVKLAGEWVNFYDKDDVFGYPLKPLNAKYRKMVKADKETNIGGFLTAWTPLSHLDYWTDSDVTKPIARSLVKLWKAVNP